jgi:isopentenyl-diphosphate delta-isomerase
VERDEVVLLSDDGEVVGSAPREGVHTRDTPLHLAYSCYLVDEQGAVLMTRRALGKRSWPGVWTNSFCGHPRPGESVADAVRRGARTELGAEIDELAPVLPGFRYQAVDAAGIVENEVCPVYRARLRTPLDPDPAEVAETRWVRPGELAAVVTAAPWALSPWAVAQVRELLDAVGDLDAALAPQAGAA